MFAGNHRTYSRVAAMMFYDYYTDVPEDALREFVTGQQLCRFITVSPDGQPHVGLYPFLFLGDSIEIHLHRNDEQLADLVVNKKCVFEVDEVHGSIPSHWVHPTNAMFATAFHRTVIYECDAVVSDDPEVLAAQQQRLMQHYQPGGGHTTVSTEHAMYRGAFREIRALTLTVRARKVKWKLAQNRDRERREKIIAELRERGRPTDAAAADALQWSLDHEAGR
jgi:transcriptional regulator